MTKSVCFTWREYTNLTNQFLTRCGIVILIRSQHPWCLWDFWLPSMKLCVPCNWSSHDLTTMRAVRSEVAEQLYTSCMFKECLLVWPLIKLRASLHIRRQRSVSTLYSHVLFCIIMGHNIKLPCWRWRRFAIIGWFCYLCLDRQNLNLRWVMTSLIPFGCFPLLKYLVYKVSLKGRVRSSPEGCVDFSVSSH